MVCLYLPQLLERIDEPFDSNEWIWELKLDGHRAIYSQIDQKSTIYTRNGNPVTARYPELVPLPTTKDICLDGEIIVMDNGVPNFEKLMERFSCKNELKISYLMKEIPATFVVFDILMLNGDSLVNLPLIKRKEILQNELSDTEHIVKIQFVEGQGEALFQAIKEQGLEGAIGKRKNSIYHVDKRTSDWLKVLNYTYRDDIWITGYRRGEFGLLASIKDEGRMRPAGVIEHGSIDLRRQFYNLARNYAKKETDEFIYIQPFVRVKVKFLHWTSSGFMRIPVLLGIITEK
ncbi:ATP-dependent DNA ligase [Bacillus sp. AFS040349]|uniref:ATP-dependent DNA ligase n=1 Tax=Bacillus sp. AFS040349 TaxID=2033502 RepID=UPI00159BAA06|nr:ATP-dependent DNA ligase [Bacillus sp. AFS040349]